MAWLRDHTPGSAVVLEAVGEDYSAFGHARMSTFTGRPTVLGWGGHEDQWRGTSAARAGRFEDVNQLYQAGDMAAVEQIVKKYGITYIYVGQLERDTYGDAALGKFSNLPVAFTHGNVTVYEAPGTSVEAAAAP
jgi:uncharacterized membrane protein